MVQLALLSFLPRSSLPQSLQHSLTPQELMVSASFSLLRCWNDGLLSPRSQGPITGIRVCCFPSQVPKRPPSFWLGFESSSFTSVSNLVVWAWSGLWWIIGLLPLFRHPSYLHQGSGNISSSRVSKPSRSRAAFGSRRTCCQPLCKETLGKR